MPRYPHLDIPPEAAATIARGGARPLNLYRILANAPAMLDAWLAFAYAIRGECSLPRSLREIVILRTAHLHCSAYEWAQHEPMARAAGVTEAQIRAVPFWQQSDAFSARERAALELTGALSDCTLTTWTEQAVHALFSDAEMIELIMTIGFYMMVPRVLLAIDATTEGEEDAECERAINHFADRIAP